MLWLEMSRDFKHGGGSWGFTLSLWAPTRKLNNDGSIGGKWPYWESILNVQAGDMVLHLREDKKVAFVGYSVAETDGFKTSERPPEPGRWGYEEYFYRVLLKDYTPFPIPIKLPNVFKEHDAALRNYYIHNKGKPTSQKLRLFYVVQAGRLQCLNGAYLSEVDDELASILLGSDYGQGTSVPTTPLVDARTGVRIQELYTRVGQKDFSDKVRSNYHHRCCFPECPITEDHFLVASHIARWADVEELRGNLSNGLCFCLMHDKAFELGLFTIDTDFKIVVNKNSGMIKNSKWYATSLFPYNGSPIRLGVVLPSKEALHHHWERIGLLSNITTASSS
jgi:putative restriction endonuclease